MHVHNRQQRARESPGHVKLRKAIMVDSALTTRVDQGGSYLLLWYCLVGYVIDLDPVETTNLRKAPLDYGKIPDGRSCQSK